MDEHVNKNTTRSNLGQDETGDSFAERVFLTALTVDKYYTPLLFIFGTLGNSLSLAVFCMNAKYRSQSASYYLSALAISDTGFLVNLLAVWLESVHGGIITSGLMCPLVMYLGQVTCFLSVYLTVAFSIERYVAVHYPLSRPRICTRSKARKIIAALTVVALLFFSYVCVIAQVIELPSGKDYEELYRRNLLQTDSLNITGESSSSEFYSLPVEGREKRETFSFNDVSPQLTSSSKELYTSNEARIPDVFEKVYICGNRSSFGKSIHSQNENQSLNNLNCTSLHLDGIILKGFRKTYPSTESSSEESSSSSLESLFLEDEKNVTGEDFLLSGGYICSVPKDYFRISEIANYLDSVVTFIIPFFLITFFNVRIAICVWKLQRQRQSIVATSAMSSGTCDINHRNHHNSLRCSNRSSIHHHKRKSASTKSKRRGSKNSGRQHLSEQQCTNSLRENEVGMSNPPELDNEGVHHAKSQKGSVRFKDVRFHTGGTSGRMSNCGGSSSSGSDGESCGYDNFSTAGNGGCVIQGLNVTPKGMGTTEALKATSKFLGKSTVLTGSRLGGSRTKMKWEQKHKAVPSRVTAKSEFPLTQKRGSNSHHPSSNAAEVRVTKTLLLVSTVFLVLNLPAHAIRCAQFIQSLRGTSEGHELLHAAQPWTNILFNTNFAVNFLLYCVSGRNFRKTLRNIMLRKFNKKLPNTWQQFSMSKGAKHEAVSTSTKFIREPVDQPPPKRNNITAELQVAEIVELEERGEIPTYPSNNINIVNHGGVSPEVGQSMPV